MKQLNRKGYIIRKKLFKGYHVYDLQYWYGDISLHNKPFKRLKDAERYIDKIGNRNEARI